MKHAQMKELGSVQRRRWRRLLVCCPLALIVSCSSITSEQEGAASQTETANPPPVEKPIEMVTDRPFSADTLYALLVAEMAIDRKRYDIALSNYVQQALSTLDVNVAARATQIARGLNARQSALEMAQLWLDLAPTDQHARIIASIELIEANHLLEAFDLAAKILKDGEDAAFESIALKAENADISVVNTLIERYEELLKQHDDHANLWLGQSLLLQKAGRYEEALKAAQKAKTLDDDPVRSAFQETQVLHKMGKVTLANKRLSELVENNPENIGLRARYARLVWSVSPNEARKQFRILHEQNPADGDILYSLALVEKDLGLLEEATANFSQLIKNDQHTSSAHFHLGEIYENTKQTDKALVHYRKVTAGQNYVAAMVNATAILVGQNRREEAIALISAEQERQQGTEAQSLYLLEADIHSKAGHAAAAEASLSDGIEKFPDSTRLLYARALLYAQNDRISAAEKDFKKVLELVPENAAALNALGYTLADATDRYQEAYEYIKQAYALTPDDPAVIDSMGWVAYRMGNYEEALQYLRQAMAALPDHEIAAHLGEVLWVTGKHQEATEIWRKGLELNPESEIIHQTMHRLEAKID